RTLALARHGEIVFFALLALAVWLWARRLIGEGGAVVAVLFAVANPTILAHAGLATTDIAAAATTTLALFAAVWWWDASSPRRSAVLGAAIGLAGASRFTAIGFVAAGLAALYLARGFASRSWTLPRSSLLAPVVAVAV